MQTLNCIPWRWYHAVPVVARTSIVESRPASLSLRRVQHRDLVHILQGARGKLTGVYMSYAVASTEKRRTLPVTSQTPSVVCKHASRTRCTRTCYLLIPCQVTLHELTRPASLQGDGRKAVRTWSAGIQSLRQSARKYRNRIRHLATTFS